MPKIVEVALYTFLLRLFSKRSPKNSLERYHHKLYLKGLNPCFLKTVVNDIGMGMQEMNMITEKPTGKKYNA